MSFTAKPIQKDVKNSDKPNFSIDDMVKTPYGVGVVAEVRNNDVLIQLGIAEVTALEKSKVEKINGD